MTLFHSFQDLYPDSYVFPQVAERSDGLHSDEARKRLKDGGLNHIDTNSEPSLSRFFLAQFHFKFWILLIGAAILSVMTYFIHMARGYNEPLNMYCAIILIAVVIFMGILSYWQQAKAKKVSWVFKTFFFSSGIDFVAKVELS